MFIHLTAVLVVSTTLNDPFFVLIFLVFCAYFCSASGFTRFAGAFFMFVHLAAALVPSRTLNDLFCIYNSSLFQISPTNLIPGSYIFCRPNNL